MKDNELAYYILTKCPKLKDFEFGKYGIIFDEKYLVKFSDLKFTMAVSYELNVLSGYIVPKKVKSRRKKSERCKLFNG
jgi:hypothetical protein